MESDVFNMLGHPIPFWVELKRRMEESEPGALSLFEEVVQLRGKVSFYESRIKEMARLASVNGT